MGLRGSCRVAGASAIAVVCAACIGFAPAVSSTVSEVDAARSVVTTFADVTGDGSDDVIVVVSIPDADDEIVRMAPCGDGCLDRQEAVTVGGTISDLAVADIDGDDIEDVVTVDSVDARVFFGGPADGDRPEGLVADDSAVAASPGFEPWRHVVAGDFDGDGDGDLTLLSAQVLEYVAGDGGGGFAAPVLVDLLPSRGSFNALAAGDIDGDGDLDTLVTGGGLGVSELVTSIDVYDAGTSQMWRHSGEDFLFQTLAVGDLDGDGLDDVAAGTSVPGSGAGTGRLLRSTGSSFTGFGPNGEFTTMPATTTDHALHDIDLDGNVDLIGVVGGQLRWWHGQGNGTLHGGAREVGAGPDPQRLAFGHVDDAALADLVVTNPTAPFAQVSYLVNRSVLPE